MNSDIVEWANENAGFLSLLLFVASAILIPLIASHWKKKKPNLKTEVIDNGTLCSSYTVDFTETAKPIHRTAFVVYLKITNTGNAPCYISKVTLGYRSDRSDDPREYRWLEHETPMLHDHFVAHGEQIRVLPFLKQRNTAIPNETDGLILPDAYKVGVVYFEQERSLGRDHPYIDEGCPDCFVSTRVRVHDTKNRYWETEHLIHEVLIETVREIYPSFGLSSESMGLTSVPDLCA